MILSDSILFSLSMLDTGALLFLLIYFLITLSDLECDYMNAQECCSRLNQWTMPKLVAHVFVSTILSMHGHFVLVFLNLPMTMWLIYEILTIPKGNLGLYDPTEIHNRGQIKKHMRDCMIYLGYYLIFFFIYLYCMITSLLKDDPLRRKDDEEIIYEF
ncbi:unnamed protein product [Phyllotreta striolata]|uniref:Protein cornichon homolog 4 n=1 Tax=Phyllotreta striolata TaxID=444603 RepID=A0A9N9XUD5_PHYSR|nr:unnamed protein product [Phyllotreta striolata]